MAANQERREFASQVCASFFLFNILSFYYACLFVSCPVLACQPNEMTSALIIPSRLLVSFLHVNASLSGSEVNSSQHMVLMMHF